MLGSGLGSGCQGVPESWKGSIFTPDPLGRPPTDQPPFPVLQAVESPPLTLS